ncbi:hypothetical protein ABPG74_000455 [Tetrahymena malaccensis]
MSYNSVVNSQVYVPLQYSQTIPQKVIIQQPPPPPPRQLISSTAILQQPPKQIVQTQVFPQPIEKPIVILNSDVAGKFNYKVNELPPIQDNTDQHLLESLNLKIDRLIRMENVLNGSISQLSSTANAKEILISQIREQRQKLEEIVRLQAIRVDELKAQLQRARNDLDQTCQIATETEKEVHNLKYVLNEKQNVVNQWKARGSEVERLNSDVNLLQSQLNQLQAQNQVLRNNIKLDPSYNYLII